MSRISILGGIGAAAALSALSMVGGTVDLVEARPRSKSRRRITRAPRSAAAPHITQPFGDGFDHDRLEAAERKRARKAARLSPSASIGGE